MFSKNTTQSSGSTPPVNTYIHTMQDDLARPYSAATSDTHSEPVATQPTQSASFSQAPKAGASPFLESLPQQPQSMPETQKISETPKQEIAPQAAVEQKPTTPNPFESLPTQTVAAKIPMPANPAMTTKPVAEYTIDDDLLQPTQKKIPTFNIIIGIIIVFVVVIIAVGGYFFWQSTTPQTPSIPSEQTAPTEQATPEATQPTQPPVTIEPIDQKYSLENPNIIIFDTETIKASEISDKLKKISEELQTVSLEKPVEFIVNDQNNISIAFARFVKLADMQISSTLLASLDEKFSLYFYKDAGAIRTGLKVKTKDKAITLTELLKEEKNLPTQLSMLFVNDKPSVMEVTFKDGNYNGNSVRYANLNTNQTLSIDYSVTQSDLFIGTSKNTLRTIIDAATPSTQTTTEDSSATNTQPTKTEAPETTTGTNRIPTTGN